MILDRSRRRLRRYREIARVVVKHGWGWMLERVGLSEHAPAGDVDGASEAAPVHLREMLEELGPTFIKLGQILSSRPDIVPQPFVDELSKLQDTAPTLPVDEIRSVVEGEFGAKIDELFAEFDEEPLAAASLAQVHRASLHDGSRVIVKVQRPGVREIVETDIEILYRRAKFLESHWERARIYGITDIVDEFALTIREELDYTREARNTDRLRSNLSHVSGVRVPAVHWELTSPRMLTLELIEGTKVTEIASQPPAGVDPKEISERLAAVFLEQVLVDGFFHADPHPGNVLVTEGGDIVLIDCGQVGVLDSDSRAGAIRMLIAFEEQDTRQFAEEILELGIGEEDVDVRKFTQDLGKVLRRYYDRPSSAVNLGEILKRVLEVSAEHRIRLPVSFTVLGKVFSSIEGICSRLNPDFNFTRAARDYIGRAVKSELHGKTAVVELYRAVAAARAFLVNLPDNLDRLLRKAVEGTLRVEFKHQGLQEVGEEFRTGTNRIAIALVVGASIVGSSLIVAAGTGGRMWLGLPALGLVGYIVASVFGIWLVISIMRPRRRR